MKHIPSLKNEKKLPRIWFKSKRPFSPWQAFRASDGFVNCTKAYPLCIDIPVKSKKNN